MSTNFSATLAPPSGLVTAGVTFMSVNGSGPLTFSGGLLTVTTQRDLRTFLGQGWTVSTLTPASGGGNQGT